MYLAACARPAGIDHVKRNPARSVEVVITGDAAEFSGSDRVRSFDDEAATAQDDKSGSDTVPMCNPQQVEVRSNPDTPGEAAGDRPACGHVATAREEPRHHHGDWGSRSCIAVPWFRFAVAASGGREARS